MKAKRFWVLAVLATLIITPCIVFGYDYDDAQREANKAFREWEEANYRLLIIRLIGLLVSAALGIVIFYIAYKFITGIGPETRKIVSNELDKKIGTTATLETCKNCGRTIGKLEESYLFEDHVVCGECHQKLKNQQ